MCLVFKQLISIFRIFFFFYCFFLPFVKPRFDLQRFNPALEDNFIYIKNDIFEFKSLPSLIKILILYVSLASVRGWN